MINYFGSSDNFIGNIDIPDDSAYEDIRRFDNSIGFSVQRAYPEESKFRPPRNKMDKPDTFALIRVGYSPEKAPDDKPHMVPIYANISPFSRYLENHYDYNYSDKTCPTEESIIASKRTPKPIELEFINDYLFDHNLNTFVDSKGNEKNGNEVLNDIYETHVATVDKMKGKILKLKLKYKSGTISIFNLSERLAKLLLSILCGRTIEPKDRSRGILGSEYHKEDLKLLKTERIDVFGYRASKNVIVTFCLLLMFLFFIFYTFGYSPQWLMIIGNNSLLTFAFAVICISLLDIVLPKILFAILNFSIRNRFIMVFKRFKFK